MRTPISYYGGKTKMLSNILPLVPKHKIYVEPYFGGGALFFAKQKSFLEVINDINGNVANFYRQMKTNFPRLLQLVEASLFDETTFKQAQQIVYTKTGSSPLVRAWAFWFITNLSFANKIGGGMKFDNGTSGTHAGRMFKTRRDEFKYYQSRLNEVQIQNRDALSVLQSRNFHNTFAFLDPPYPGADQGHYKKEGFNTGKLIELLEFLQTDYKGKFMLCNYHQDCFTDFINKNNWNLKQFGMRLSANANQKSAIKNRKTEVIITNYIKTPTLQLSYE